MEHPRRVTRIPLHAIASLTLVLAGAMAAPGAHAAEDDEVPDSTVQLQVADPRGHNLPDALPDPDAPVHVLVREQSSGGRTVYSYRVVNDSPFPLGAVLIGFDLFRQDNELRENPVGWSGNEGPASGVTAPRGWRGTVVPMEDTRVIHVEWRPADPAGGIPSGGSLGGFQVEVDEPDRLYEHGHFTAFASSGEEAGFNDLIGAETGLARTPEPQVRTAKRLWTDTRGNRVRATFVASCACRATVDVFDAAGKRVSRLFDGVAHPGENVVTWDRGTSAGGIAAPGTYFVRARTASHDEFSKLLLR